MGGLFRCKLDRAVEPVFDCRHVAILLYPSKMLYPGILPLVSMFDTLFKDAAAAQRKLKIFWIAFFWLVVTSEPADSETELTPL